MLLAHTREKKIFLSRALPKIAFFRGRIRKLFTCSRDSLQLCASSFFFPPDSPLSPTLALTDLRAHKKGCKIAEHQPTSQEENPQHTFFSSPLPYITHALHLFFRKRFSTFSTHTRHAEGCGTSACCWKTHSTIGFFTVSTQRNQLECS